MFTLAHLSDPHATPVRVPRGRLSDLLGKRATGWISWRLARRHEYRPEVLEALGADLRELDPDHVAVTGDLTNLSLEDEFPAARRWLEGLGSPERVTVIPGNHDAYVPLPFARSWEHWDAYMRSDPDEPSGAAEAERFPSVRVRGPVALIGLCSARPSPLREATGSLGAAQLAALEKALAELGGRGLCRVVLVHHPPTDDVVSARRRLTDAADLRAVLARTGAELVLHGHTHRSSIARVDGPHGSVPAVGVRSASAVGRKPGRRAQYHLCRIEPRPGGGPDGSRYRIRLDVRGYDPATRRFTAQERHSL